MAKRKKAKRTKLKTKQVTTIAVLLAIIAIVIIVIFSTTGITAQFFAPRRVMVPPTIEAKVTPPPIAKEVKCPNRICDPGETLQTCPVDCAVCLDGICTPPVENPQNCFADCGCGNGICNKIIGETLKNCPRDCAVCGDGICTLWVEHVQNCPQDCWVCGDGTCTPQFETLQTCPQDCAVCGDNICTRPQEGGGIGTQPNCPADCSVLCNDGNCEGGESVANRNWKRLLAPSVQDPTCQADCSIIFGDGNCSRGERAAGGALAGFDCATCGDNVCEEVEVSADFGVGCLADCGIVLGDGRCTQQRVGFSENATNSRDCAVCGDDICADEYDFWWDESDDCPEDCP